MESCSHIKGEQSDLMKFTQEGKQKRAMKGDLECAESSHQSLNKVKRIINEI